MMKQICRELIERSMEENPTRNRFQKMKVAASRKYKLDHIIRNSEILSFSTEEERIVLSNLLLKKPTRSISGVSVVAVMSPPHTCPHGRCTYCPRGENAAQSYTGKEPAARRGIMNNYDPYKQVRNRLDQLNATGHPTDKIELIIMGGTFPSRPFREQRDFVKGCLDAMTRVKTKSIAESIRIAEHSKVRPVGITFETKPDYAKQEQINNLLKIGTTRVEIGVQTTYNSIYKKVNRGHTVEDVVEATQLLKDSALKVCYHMMPGLPGSTYERDLRSFRKIFNDQNFRPDMIKIYPTLVMEGTKLYDDWKRGEYEPLSTEKAAELVVRVKKFVPPWVRIMRVQRDIPSNLIGEGVKKSNLRQIALEKAECSCIRCREAGHRFNKNGLKPENIEIRTTKYKASGGTEYFISAEDFGKGILVGYLRLRLPSKPFRKEINKKTALVRELHVYGKEVSIGKDAKNFELQHRGFGKKLLEKAEEISQSKDMEKVAVMSGIGAREYYRKLGYKPEGPYMVKLKKNINSMPTFEFE